MKLFNDYKDAVMSNGSTKSVYINRTENKFCHLTPDWRVMSNYWKECNPADYLESIESFLASGKRLVNGDRYVENDGEVMLVSRHGSDDSVPEDSVPEDSANRPMKDDDRRFILQSAADQVETPEEKEALDAIDTTPKQVESLSCSGKLHDSAFLVEPDEFTLCDDIKERVGDACMVHYQFTNSKGYEMCTIEFDDGYCHCVVAQFLETEFEREEREVIDQMYYDVGGDLNELGTELCDNDALSVIERLCKAGYRKQ